MISRLRGIRLTLAQILVVAATSAIATALIINSASGGGGLPTAELAALTRQVVVHRSPRSAPTPTPVRTAAAASPSPATQSSAPAQTSSSSSGAGASQDTPATSNTSTTATTATTPTNSTTPAAATPAKPTYKVKHVFIIALSTTSYQAVFGRHSLARYLNGTLRRKGTLLSNYRTLGSTELPDYLAMVSGQAPNADTRADCTTYAEFPSTAKAAANGQVSGRGCIYPDTALTIGDQVTGAGKRWKAYIDAMGSSTCEHPNSNALADTQLAGPGSQYATRHNPFIYFHSLLDLGDCSSDDVTLDRLPTDLRSVSKTPSYAFISPGACDDASVLTCPAISGTSPSSTTTPNQPGGLAAEDAFLKLWVPKILGSPAYKRNGALMIVFTATPPATTTGHPSADHPVRTGALILSRYAKADRTLTGSYDPYSVLRAVEELFGYALLAHAHGAKSFLTSALPGA
jgi:hypothetical protein